VLLPRVPPSIRQGGRYKLVNHGGANAKPSNPLPDHPKPEEEFEATAQWDSEEEEATDNATNRPGTPTQQASSLPADTWHTENTSLAPTQQAFSPRAETQRTENTPPTPTSTGCAESTPPRTTSPQQMENTPLTASPTHYSSDHIPAFRLLGYPSPGPLVQPQNQPARHMGDSWPTTPQAATQYSGSKTHTKPHRSQSSSYSPGVSHLPSFQNRPPGYTTVESSTPARPYPAQHSPPNTNPFPTTQHPGRPPPTIRNPDPTRRFTHPPSGHQEKYMIVPKLTQPYPAQHSGGPPPTIRNPDPTRSFTHPQPAPQSHQGEYMTVPTLAQPYQAQNFPPSTNPYHTTQYHSSPPSAIRNPYPTQSFTHPPPVPQKQPARHTVDESWTQTPHRGYPGGVAPGTTSTVRRSTTVPRQAMSPIPNRVPHNPSFGNPSTGHPPAVSPPTSHAGYRSPVSPSGSNANYYQHDPPASHTSYGRPTPLSPSTTHTGGYGQPASTPYGNIPDFHYADNPYGKFLDNNDADSPYIPVLDLDEVVGHTRGEGGRHVPHGRWKM
jgi:hypothetical protein